ncbi:transcriptional regulator [Hypericibacter terrae]|uniref:Transcriptional regulator n=1 Tax=Hypericibacter terrae TaxID=2602015 RepID=A0A5J6MN36_9PROT|nr:transcriptional regulator [Hypericibacter terrae]
MLTTSDHLHLRRAPLFAQMPGASVDRLVSAAHAQNLAARSLLFDQGEAAAFLYVILSGRVGLVGRGMRDHEMVVEFFGPGDVFIIPAVTLELPLLMAARVLDDARIVLIPAAHVRDMIARDHAFASAVVRELSRHWRLLVTQIKDLKLRRAPQRLAAHLLSLPRSRSGELHLLEERQLIAQRLGMTPESLSRAFADLKRLGVTARGKHIVIADPAGLERFAAIDGAP